MKTLSERLLSARHSIEYADDQDPPGHAPDYYDHLRRMVRRAARQGVTYLAIVLYARISDPRPGKRETTSDQLRACEDAITSLEQEFGVTIDVIGRFEERVSGWQFSKQKRAELIKAAKLASERNAVLVAFDVSRFVRNEDYKYNQALPTVDDFDQLMRLVGKAQLATIADPEIHEDRSRSTKRGFKVNNAKPGRPKKRTYRKPFTRMPKKFARVVRLRNRGTSWGEIAAKVSRSRSTVRGWYAQGMAGCAIFSKNGQEVAVSHGKSKRFPKSG